MPRRKREEAPHPLDDRAKKKKEDRRSHGEKKIFIVPEKSISTSCNQGQLFRRGEEGGRFQLVRGKRGRKTTPGTESL